MRSPFYVRCYAKRDGDQWVAICIDLCLAAQADSLDEAKSKLEEQVNDYVFEALTIDREHAAELLGRRAPLSQQFEYYRLRVEQRLEQLIERHQAPPERAFTELVALPA